MPFVEIKFNEGVLNKAQKQEMIKKDTDTMVSIEGEKMRQATWVTMNEIKSGDWGIGGYALTADAVKSMAGEPAAGYIGLSI